MIVHVISFAFLMVLASTAMLSPVLLYVFGLADLGWRWEHAAMFSAILASTDAVAVSAVLKSGAPPRPARHACEAESMAAHPKGIRCDAVLRCHSQTTLAAPGARACSLPVAWVAMRGRLVLSVLLANVGAGHHHTYLFWVCYHALCLCNCLFRHYARCVCRVHQQADWSTLGEPRHEPRLEAEL